MTGPSSRPATRNLSWRLLCLGAVLAACHGWLASGRGAEANDGPAIRDAQVEALAARIDHHLDALWKSDEVKPAPPADDAEFLRRVYLDLAGRIPTVAEARSFLQDTAVDKRERLVLKLLESAAFANHFTNVYRAVLLPESNSFESRFLAQSLESWLHKQFRDNVPYDKIARDVLTLGFGNPGRQQAITLPGQQQGEPTPIAFYQANEFKPENLAASTARVFLGVRLECAQCHNHPFAGWKQEQFWSYAAFFAGLQRANPDAFAAGRELADRRELTIPGTETVVQAGFLDGSEPEWKFRTSPRETLAGWVTSKENAYFARAAVNRLWAHFFGIGIVDPVDDLEGETQASHPELLDELATEFVKQGFDLKFMIRAITTSKAYQLTSRVTDKSQDDPRHFARMALKGLTPEQVFDSVQTATGFREAIDNPQPFFAQGPRAEFLTRFSNRSDKRTETQTSILQALSLMNGRVVADATSLERSELLAGLLDAPFFTDAQRIETLYLATLSRKPKAAEAERLMKYVQQGGPTGDRKKALADVFWALLNSGEFILNH